MSFNDAMTIINVLHTYESFRMNPLDFRNMFSLHFQYDSTGNTVFFCEVMLNCNILLHI